jgi:hypothetical protein
MDVGIVSGWENLILVCNLLEFTVAGKVYEVLSSLLCDFQLSHVVHLS